MPETSIQTPPGFSELSKAEQVQYLQSLWDQISEHPDDIPVPESHLQLAEERLRRYRENPSSAVPAFDILDSCCSKFEVNSYRMPKKNRQMPPVHPEEILREDLMKPLGLSVNGLARELKVPVTRISEIVNGRRSLNADTALRLSRYFGSTPEFWISLRAAYDLSVTINSSAHRIEREVRPRAKRREPVQSDSTSRYAVARP